MKQKKKIGKLNRYQIAATPVLDPDNSLNFSLSTIIPYHNPNSQHTIKPLTEDIAESIACTPTRFFTPNFHPDDNNCPHPFIAHNKVNGEGLCPICGEVFYDNDISHWRDDTNLDPNGNDFYDGKPTRRRFKKITKWGHYIRYLMQKKYAKDDYGDMHKWRKKQQARMVGIYATIYDMNWMQQRRAKFIVDRVSLKKLYPPGTCELIILAICFYVMRKKDRRVLSYQEEIPREVGLNKKNYRVIANKLDSKGWDKKLLTLHYVNRDV